LWIERKAQFDCIRAQRPKGTLSIHISDYTNPYIAHMRCSVALLLIVIFAVITVVSSSKSAARPRTNKRSSKAYRRSTKAHRKRKKRQKTLSIGFFVNSFVRSMIDPVSFLEEHNIRLSGGVMPAIDGMRFGFGGGSGKSRGAMGSSTKSASPSTTQPQAPPMAASSGS
jgi:hypothetical protein